MGTFVRFIVETGDTVSRSSMFAQLDSYLLVPHPASQNICLYPSFSQQTNTIFSCLSIHNHTYIFTRVYTLCTMVRGFSQRTNYVYSAILSGLARTIFVQGNLSPNVIVPSLLECTRYSHYQPKLLLVKIFFPFSQFRMHKIIINLQ